MQYGHFDDENREYVITRPDTPRSWTNYLGDTQYGAIISNNAGGFSFYQSAADGRFTRMRFNSVPMDQPGRYFYLRDAESGDFWSSSWQPVGKPLEQFKSTCRHGTAYTQIDSEYSNIKTESLYFVPIGQTFEYWKLKVTNTGSKPRKLSVFTYVEFANFWNHSQDLVNLQYSQYIGRAKFEDGLVQMAVNDNLGRNWRDFNGENNAQLSWMTLLGSEVSGYDLSRETFIGPYGSYEKPDVVASGVSKNSTTYGDNSCGSLRTEIELAPGESKEILVLLGVGDAQIEGKAAIESHGDFAKVEEELAKVKNYWHSRLESLSVETPDKNFDSMVNVWNIYNCLITYAWSRAASFVYNGERNGLGFRDTVQDILAVLPAITDEAGQRLELMLTGQYSNGGALPVVKPFQHKPGATPMTPEHEFRSDDCLWFFNTIPAYVAETGKVDFYNKVLPYADQGEATVLGHMRRALEFNLERSGANNLPCGLAADWNDCLKLGYHGESLFVAFQVRLGLGVYADAAKLVGKPKEAEWALAKRDELDAAIQKTCWSKDHFIWAIAEDGTVYGTHESTEGSVYLNTQVWSVLSGAASDEQAATCMDTLDRELATDYGLQLCAPPVTTMPVRIMAARLFNPGTKENAGIFNHPQGWAVIADCMLGNGDRAYKFHTSYLPASFNDKAEIRGSEPYVHCQSTHARYSPMHGAARLPWLTGAATWCYYSSTAYILGIRAELEGLRVDPCLPSSWPGYKANRLFRGMNIKISVSNPNGSQKGVASMTVDGKPVEGTIAPIELLKDGSQIEVVMK
ncbi:hypothetical protein [Pelagicoccus sp. SDUM812003]|uniref:GH36-type glycosyl hydrolase domain-containing protein n=1 Tax=Pelagicoccus sp. SDUM812003 TaxID=3041267 RepID=UPI00280DEEEB|nr:hypothetical protein [Pelagicoccus sp. SDUM812003]MDQ8205687.1 hypothetical protein [Pelagicoccus sp. SDUM812003]